MSLVHAFIGLSAYLSVCVCLSLCYLFISFYYGFIPDSNKWIGWSGLDLSTAMDPGSLLLRKEGTERQRAISSTLRVAVFDMTWAS